MLYDTVLLRSFVAICDSGSFTKAAREVNLTQSAVSLHVKRLEDQVGSCLIVRNARGVGLTDGASRRTQTNAHTPSWGRYRAPGVCKDAGMRPAAGRRVRPGD
jgi:hypothetical protein